MAHVYDGGVDLFNTLASGQTHPGTMEFISSRWNNMSNTLSETSRRFVDRAKEVFESATNNEAMRLARAASRRVKSLWDSDKIKRLQDIGALQHAKPTMQRYIMANPVVRERFYAQRLDGYSDSYVDVHPGVVGEKHYDYRRVMNGIVKMDDDDNYDEGWVATNYYEDLLEGDRDLGIDEQAQILSTWAWVEHRLKTGKEDPTSVYNADLG